MSQKISDVMTPMPHTIGHDISVEKAREMMHEYGCHHLPVLDGGHLVGLVSERDLRIAAALTTGADTKVEVLMSDEPLTVDPDQLLKEVVQTMLKEKIGSVIVRAKDGKSWGIFTVSDALKILDSHL